MLSEKFNKIVAHDSPELKLPVIQETEDIEIPMDDGRERFSQFSTNALELFGDELLEEETVDHYEETMQNIELNNQSLIS